MSGEVERELGDGEKINSLKLFEDKLVRSVWDEKEEKWWFSVVDIVGILSGASNPRRYWSDLKIKIKKEGGQLYDKIVQLKMQSGDGKFYATDVADTEQVFRIIQSIPSRNYRHYLPNLGGQDHQGIQGTEGAEEGKFAR